MNGMAKLLIVTGLFLVGIGILFLLVGKVPGIGRLPGDIYIKRENFTLYLPITTCVLISLILSLLLYLWNQR